MFTCQYRNLFHYDETHWYRLWRYRQNQNQGTQVLKYLSSTWFLRIHISFFGWYIILNGHLISETLWSLQTKYLLQSTGLKNRSELVRHLGTTTSNACVIFKQRDHIWSSKHYCRTKDSIASQRYATPRDFAVNYVTLRKWRHQVKGVLNYDNEGSNYRLHQRVRTR